ncbi:MAG TPA: SDR family oxidoreductase [Polyangiaceae bacterium]|jgi:NAD(P)-dependent dehydrogenase (short-subunit alcohol dehydrogenase family)|nr:SDR family oxidoreductase [Polyangiaceae bacterium]
MTTSIFRDGILEGRVALVTGGGSGIGAGIAKRLAAQGAKVMLLGRRPEMLEAVAGEIKTAGGVAIGQPTDVREYADVEKSVERTVRELGGLDIVVCSAAGNFLSPAATLSANGFKAVIGIDLLGTFNVCRASFEHLAKQGGSIVSISAPQAFVPTALQVHVGAAKAGIEKMTRDLALEWGGSGIRVNTVVPGPTEDTEGMRRLAPEDPAVQAKMKKGIPLGRWGKIDEIADAVLYLVSPAAAYITATTLVVDGGSSLISSGRFAFD